MQYAIAAAALFAGAAFAGETVTAYDTEIHTVTSCGPEVTNCPAKSTHEGKPPGYWGHESSWAEASSSATWAESTSTSSATWVESTSAPVEYSSSWVESTTISSVWATSTPIEVSSTWVASSSVVSPVSESSVWYPASSSVVVVPTGSAPAASSWAPSGTGVGSATPSSPVPYNAAGSVQAAGLLVGAGAVAALFL